MSETPEVTDAAIAAALAKVDAALRVAEAFDTAWEPAARRRALDFRKLSVVLGLLVKGARTVRGVRLLCHANLGGEALALARCLVEILAMLKTIEADTTDTAWRRIHHHSQLGLAQFTRDALECPEFAPTVSAHSDGIEHSAERDAAAEFGEAEVERLKKRWHPNGWDLRVWARKTGNLPLYVIGYRLGSRAMHATDYTDYFFAEDQHTAHVPDPRRWTLGVLDTAGQVLLDVLLVADSILGSDLRSNIESERSRLFPPP